jgi:hypothetical protein
MAIQVSPIKIELEGMAGVAEAIRVLEDAFGATSNDGISLQDPPRTGGGKTNFEILMELQEEMVPPRAICPMTDADCEPIAQVYVDVIIREIQRVFKLMEKRKLKGKAPLKGNEANTIDRLALRAAMKTYMNVVSQRIEKQEDYLGRDLQTFAPLAESYRRWKIKKFGFDYPELKATGQIMEAMNPEGAPKYKYIRRTTNTLDVSSVSSAISTLPDVM